MAVNVEILFSRESVEWYTPALPHNRFLPHGSVNQVADSQFKKGGFNAHREVKDEGLSIP